MNELQKNYLQMLIKHLVMKLSESFDENGNLTNDATSEQVHVYTYLLYTNLTVLYQSYNKGNLNVFDDIFTGFIECSDELKLDEIIKNNKNLIKFFSYVMNVKISENKNPKLFGSHNDTIIVYNIDLLRSYLAYQNIISDSNENMSNFIKSVHQVQPSNEFIADTLKQINTELLNTIKNSSQHDSSEFNTPKFNNSIDEMCIYLTYLSMSQQERNNELETLQSSLSNNNIYDDLTNTLDICCRILVITQINLELLQQEFSKNSTMTVDAKKTITSELNNLCNFYEDAKRTVRHILSLDGTNTYNAILQAGLKKEFDKKLEDFNNQLTTIVLPIYSLLQERKQLVSELTSFKENKKDDLEIIKASNILLSVVSTFQIKKEENGVHFENFKLKNHDEQITTAYKAVVQSISQGCFAKLLNDIQRFFENMFAKDPGKIHKQQETDTKIVDDCDKFIKRSICHYANNQSEQHIIEVKQITP